MNHASDFLKKEECLLLLVDIQKVLLEPCVNKEVIVKNCSFLIEAAVILNIPVLFTTHNKEKLGDFIKELTQKVTIPQIINKVEFSCFENRGIRKAIEDLGKKTIILTGLESHVCIFHTGAHALRLGYRVDLVTDAVSSRTEQNRLVGIKRLEQAGAVMSSTEMVIFEWLGKAGTEEFRKLLPIIKQL